MKLDLYSIPIKDYQGRTTTLSNYKNNVLLICNIASNCGLAKMNYTGLADVADMFKENGLKIILFPSNSFFQEPNAAKKIKDLTEEYSDNFLVFDKIDVCGNNKHDIFKYLCDNYDNGWYGNMVKWNFTKFLVDRKGNVRMRYGPMEGIDMNKIQEIRDVLAEDGVNNKSDL